MKLKLLLFPKGTSPNWVPWAALWLLLLMLTTRVQAQDSNLGCNTFTSTNWISTPFSSLTAAGTGSSPGNTINASTSDYATLSASGQNVSIGDPTNNYTSAGYYINAHVGRPALTGAGNVTIATFLGATAQDTYTTSLGAAIAATTDDIGFTTTKPFNRITITNGSNNDVRVYYVSLQRYCSYNPACNTSTPFVQSNFPVVIDAANTSPAYTITNPLLFLSNSGNVIDSDITNSAGLAILAAGTGTVAVHDVVNEYPAGYFAGFRIKNTAVLGASLLNNITITTYNNGVITADANKAVSSAILDANLLNSNGEQTVGIITTVPFDEIKITISLLGFQFGTTDIYNAVIEKFCDNPLTACNTPTRMIDGAANYPVFIDNIQTGVVNLGCAQCSVADAANVIDADTNDYASIQLLASVLSTARLAIKSQQTGGYPAGTFAGFDYQDIRLAGASLGSQHTVRTFFEGTEQESYTDGGAVGSAAFFTSSGRQVVGFKTKKAFDEVTFEVTNGANVGIATTHIFGLILEKFCPVATPLACNTNTQMVNPTRAVFIDGTQTGIQSVLCGQCDIKNSGNVINSNTGDYAEVVLPGSFATVATFGVTDGANIYPANTFAGFDISSPVLVGANVLSGLQVVTLLDGHVVETVSTSNGLLSLNSSIVAGTGRQTVGFLASAPFNSVKLIFTQGLALDLGTTRIYNAVFKAFCAGTPLVCNTMTPITNTGYPVYVDGKNTGINVAGCTGCNINFSENVIDQNATTPAEVILVGGVASSATFAVANAIDTYPATTFAGFDVESTTLFSANALASATISLYNNGTLVQSGTGNALIVGATSSLLTGGASRQIIGLVGNVPFDEVKLTFNQLGGANLGTIKIYRAVVQKGCAKTVACNNTYYLNNPDFPTVIDGGKTGFTGAACGACIVQDPWNVVSANAGDFARIQNTASGLSTGSIAVVDPIDTYPAGTFAGFTIKKNAFLLSGDLFPYITITTYLDGVQQESKTGGALLDLTAFVQFFGTPTSFYNAGFIASKPFDEVQIGVGSLVGALAQFVDVYGAFIDTRSSTNGGSLVCNFVINPDFNVTTVNVPVPGNVHTNDVVPAGTTYGTPVPSGSNPAGGTITMSPDGTYSFTATSPGTYTYTVPVCSSGVTTNCPTSPLIITVLDPNVTTNPPVANPDYVSTAINTPVTVNVRANDGPGNPGGVLGTPTIVTQPTHGTATVNGSGNVVYTPAKDYTGDDILTYQVCETPSGLCKTTTETIHVVAPGSTTVTAVDDYNKTPLNTPVSGNVLTNDIGSGLTVSNAGTITSPGKGTLVLGSNGAYTFVPTPGVTGPVDFTYTACDSGPVCSTATLHILVTPVAPVLNPDFNVTNVNVPVPGNVSTNDVVPTGTTYGTPVPSGSNPSGGTITLTPTGSYTFTATSPGTYTYTVPVCAPGQSTGCPTTPLIITVLDPTSAVNPPVANPDYASTNVNTPVTVNVKANDGPGNPGGTLGTPTIVTQPTHGTATVDGSGNVVYTPATGYVGDDILTYQVCETPGGLCKTATEIIHVVAPGSTTVTAIDDYTKTPMNTPVSGNVLTNDIGSGLTVSNAGTITSPGKGTLVLGSNGAYTFTPTPGVSGPVDFTYTACDSGPVCSTATLHILVAPVPDLTPIIYALPSTQYGTTNFTVVVDVFDLETVSSNGLITVYVSKDPLASLSFNPSSVLVGGKLVQNNIWTLDNSDSDFYILTTSQVIAGQDKKSFGFTGVLTPGNTQGTLTISTTVVGGSGGETRIDNNSDADKIDYFKK